MYNEYAHAPEMKGSIHSAIQLRVKNVIVDDIPMTLGGKQRLVCKNHGTEHIFPLVVDKGLCYLPMRYPTDEEMENLPQLIMTSDKAWDP